MVLSPWGSTSWAMRSASVVAMSTLAGTTTKLMVSCLRIYFLMRDLIYKKMGGYESWDRSWLASGLPSPRGISSKKQTQRNAEKLHFLREHCEVLTRKSFPKTSNLKVTMKNKMPKELLHIHNMNIQSIWRRFKWFSRNEKGSDFRRPNSMSLGILRTFLSLISDHRVRMF